MPEPQEHPRGTDMATVRTGAGLVTYVQVWSVPGATSQDEWLQVMRQNIHILRSKPGFVTMTLHSSLDGTRIAVYAQWASQEALEASIHDPAAVAAHERMAQLGTADGSLYLVDDVYGPLDPGR